MISNTHLPDTEPAYDWRQDAACRSEDPDLMYPNPTDVLGIADAKQVCRTCPVLWDCRGWALQLPELYGVWGGLSEADRDQLLGRRRKRDPDAPKPAPRPPARCGTEAGYRRHTRQKTAVCGPCQVARSVARAKRRRAKQQKAPP